MPSPPPNSEPIILERTAPLTIPAGKEEVIIDSLEAGYLDIVVVASNSASLEYLFQLDGQGEWESIGLLNTYGFDEQRTRQFWISKWNDTIPRFVVEYNGDAAPYHSRIRLIFKNPLAPVNSDIIVEFYKIQRWRLKKLDNE